VNLEQDVRWKIKIYLEKYGKIIRQWQGLTLAEVVRRKLAAYAASNNTELDGPEVMVSPEAGPAMAMVAHELVTNAAKYGALWSGVCEVAPEAERERAIHSRMAGNRRTKGRSSTEIWLWHQRNPRAYPLRTRRSGRPFPQSKN
jgi:two-component sensor histidine kinase